MSFIRGLFTRSKSSSKIIVEVDLCFTDEALGQALDAGAGAGVVDAVHGGVVEVADDESGGGNKSGVPVSATNHVFEGRSNFEGERASDMAVWFKALSAARYEALSMDEDDFIPIIHLYFSDDLSVA